LNDFCTLFFKKCIETLGNLLHTTQNLPALRAGKRDDRSFKIALDHARITEYVFLY